MPVRPAARLHDATLDVEDHVTRHRWGLGRQPGELHVGVQKRPACELFR